MRQPRPAERLLRSMITFGRVARARTQSWSVGGEHGLSHNEVVALGLIGDHDSCRATAVSGRMNVGPSVVSRLVGSLAERGLVEREPDPGDRRAELLRLTDAGRRTLVSARTSYVQALAGHLDAWDTERINRAADVLDDLSLALSNHARSPHE